MLLGHFAEIASLQTLWMAQALNRINRTIMGTSQIRAQKLFDAQMLTILFAYICVTRMGVKYV